MQEIFHHGVNVSHHWQNARDQKILDLEVRSDMCIFHRIFVGKKLRNERLIIVKLPLR